MAEITEADVLGEVISSGPTLIEGQMEGLRQILNNLLSNAIKFGEGSRIRIRLENTELEVRGTVEDNGRGITYAFSSRSRPS